MLNHLRYCTVYFALILAIGMVCPAWSAEKVDGVGHIVALRGDVRVVHNNTIEAAVKNQPLSLTDSVKTLEKARVKMRFSDDSVLTLSENSQLSIRQYLYQNTTDQGGSIFDFVEGTLRTLVGKGDLEIHTTTAVAAARGTLFFVRVYSVNGQSVTEIYLLEGTLEVRNINLAVQGSITLTPGMTTSVTPNEAPQAPQPIIREDLKNLLNCGRTQAVQPSPPGVTP